MERISDVTPTEHKRKIELSEIDQRKTKRPIVTCCVLLAILKISNTLRMRSKKVCVTITRREKKHFYFERAELVSLYISHEFHYIIFYLVVFVSKSIGATDETNIAIQFGH